MARVARRGQCRTSHAYPARRRRKQSSRRPWAVALCSWSSLLVGRRADRRARLRGRRRQIAADPQALAALSVAPTGEHVASVSVADAAGPAASRSASGTARSAGRQARPRRADRGHARRCSGRRWVGWLVGRNGARLGDAHDTRDEGRGTLLHLAPNAPVLLRFDGPASLVIAEAARLRQQHLASRRPPRGSTPGLATGPNRFGARRVPSAARSVGEALGPGRVSWFPSGRPLEAVVKPAPGTVIEPSTPIQADLLRAGQRRARPRAARRLDPATPGAWTQTAANVLTFKPRARATRSGVSRA